MNRIMLTDQLNQFINEFIILIDEFIQLNSIKLLINFSFDK